ncbi:SusC/RagA family TonB-linked outer membrane protein [Chitinophaga defluvii]|uniref:SusC/RagA family TonB-linked outer membrane protein n=1 Tax=Chitinophaga defluvii TaxID=3163343 RepID=A0ABV2TBT5_9BACT
MKENVYNRKGRKYKLLLIVSVLMCCVLAVRAEATALITSQETEKLPALLKKLEKQFHVTFAYDATEISKDLEVDINPANLTIDAVLKQLQAIGISSKQVGDKVILKKSPPVNEYRVMRADIIVKGRVNVRSGTGGVETIPGINVVEKGTRNGTVSDADGNFTLKVQEGATLLFSMIGYKSFEVRVTGAGMNINVTLEKDVSNLQEVVISSGYQKIDRRLFTGAATKLKADDVKMEGVIDVSRMLEGRAAGVSVQNVSGTFGTAPKIRVRGATSITGDNKPLWVIDGVVLEDVVNVSMDQLSTGDATTLIGSSVAGVNADDIESFDILKDAAATALYGARAMNGVIVITTKKGRAGKTKISYTGNFSMLLKPTYSTFNIMNSADQMSVYSELQRKGWLNHSDVARSADGGVFAKMYDLIDSYDPATKKYGLENTPEARAAFLERYARANTDWFDLLFRNSITQEHSLSLSSGTDHSQYYFSTSFYNDNGWSVGDNVKRYTANLRANYQLSDRLTVGFITSGSVRDQKAPGTVTRVSNPVEGKYDRDFDINPFSYALNTSRTLTAYDTDGELEYFRRNFAPFNILNELRNNTLALNMLDLRLQGEVTYKIAKSLNYNFLGSIRTVKTSREHNVKENANMAEAYRAAGSATIRDNNKFLYRDPDNPEAEPVVVLPQGGFYNRTEDQLVNYSVRNTLNWSQTFNDIHMVNLFGGQEIKYANRQNSWFNGYGYQFDKGGVPFTDYRILKQLLEANYNYYGMDNKYDRFVAFFANGSYSYRGKYTFNGTARMDGSNQLGAASKARWLPTWNVSGSWNVREEPFMQNVRAIDMLTLRATYGLTAAMGNATNSKAILRNVTTRRPYFDEVESAIILESLENSELTWEKQYETNVGLDIGFFKGRLNVSVDAYNRNGFDLISAIRTSGIGGQEYKLANYADMKSHGLEFTLGAGIVDKKDFSWRSNFTLGYNKNKITNLKSAPNIFSLVVPEGGPQEGYAVRGLFSIDFQGLDPKTGIPLFINEQGETSNNVYLQSLTTEHLKYEGPVDPTLTGGFANTFRYKSLSLNVFFTYQAGNKIRLNPAFKNSYTDLDATPKEFQDRWTLPGDEQFTNIPSILYRPVDASLNDVHPYRYYNYSSQMVADGGFIRLKTLSLLYNLPARWTSAIGAGNASLNLIAQNLWLIYADPKLKGQDPEFFSAGGVALPVPRQFTLSVKVGF